MSDLRELQPPERVFEIALRGTVTHEIEITAWPYSGIKSEKVISEKLIYRVSAVGFDDARAQAEIALQTVKAMHDIWEAKIVRIAEARP